MSKWIEFELLKPPENLTYIPRTKRWAIQRKALNWTQLGLIKWANSWRKYAFYPYENTLFEEDCLRDIANFIEIETKKHKTPQKKGR